MSTLKDGRSHGDRDEEQLSLCSQDGERPVEGSVDRVGTRRHGWCSSVRSHSEQPVQEIHGENRHARTENDSRQQALASPFAVGVAQPADNDGD